MTGQEPALNQGNEQVLAIVTARARRGDARFQRVCQYHLGIA